MAGEVVVARLLVTFASSKRAACDTLWTTRVLALGDGVRFTAHAQAGVDSSVASGGVSRSAPVPRRSNLRGRAGARWLSVAGSGASFQQPSLNLRLDGSGVGGGHMDVAIDVRSRRTTRDFGGVRSNDQLSRFYRASLTVRSLDAHRRFTVGRQSSPTLASINLFDGALLELGTARRSVGVFSGTQPDPVRLGFSPDVVQSGVYAEWHQAPDAARRWTAAFGGVTSQQGGQPNRDFLFAQSWWFSKGVNLSFNQEIDVNRGWKRALGEPALSPTSTFSMVRVPLTNWFSVNSGYDNRRNVRLYRDRLTPETQFDDQYREGAWIGGQFSAANRLRLSVESRGNAGSDRAHSWTGSAELYRLTRINAAIHARASRFYGASVESRLESLGLSLEPSSLSHVDIAGGVRRTGGAFSLGEDVEHWESADLDLSLGRRWYLNGGWERDHGGSAGDTRQVQAGLSLRF